MSSPRLIFHPREPRTVVSADKLVHALSAIEFLSEPLPGDTANRYAVGEGFIELLTFLGCSPVIRLSPEDGENYCYIELPEPGVPRLIHGKQPFVPRCKQCRAAIEDWQAQLQAGPTIECHACGNATSPDRVNWKQSAGYASQFIVVHNIYLHEAVPGEKLMATLEGLTDGQGWGYFYAL